MITRPLRVELEDRMVSTYVNAVKDTKDIANGLSVTNQGGFAYAIDDEKKVRRFLILGTDGGTFYASEQKHTQNNVESIQRLLDRDGKRLVDIIVEISEAGRAPRNEPAIFALALAASYMNPDRLVYATEVRRHALANLSKVARTGTHLFHFAEYVDHLRGWGTSLRKGVGNWYLEMDNEKLARQVTKYQQRDGWSHADLLRKTHPIAQDATKNAIFKYVVDGERTDLGTHSLVMLYLNAVESMKTASVSEAVTLIERYHLPREVVPTEMLKEPKIWEALLYSGRGMPMEAMTRNLATMTRIGVIEQGSDASRFVIDRLNDENAIVGAKLHPISLLKAKLTYQAGKSVRGNNEWVPLQSVVDALESGFYLSFGSVEPTNKRILMALDVSGSMTFGETYAYGYSYHTGTEGLGGVIGLSPRIAVACLAMVTARVERDYEILGFEHRLVDLNISKHDSLNTVMAKVQKTQFGGTDCSLPFTYAMNGNKKFDAFMVFTDNETGGQNPSSILKKYRQKSGIHDAKLVVNGMTAGNFSIADPSDQNMLDVVGFDSAAPHIMSSFIRGEI
jgi:60 kDa SS-A/Ro ribonucleoprotein